MKYLSRSQDCATSMYKKYNAIRLGPLRRPIMAIKHPNYRSNVVTTKASSRIAFRLLCRKIHGMGTVV